MCLLAYLSVDFYGAPLWSHWNPPFPFLQLLHCYWVFNVSWPFPSSSNAVVLRVPQAHLLSLYIFSIMLISVRISLCLYIFPTGAAFICIFLLWFSLGHKGQLCSISKLCTSALASDWIHPLHFSFRKWRKWPLYGIAVGTKSENVARHTVLWGTCCKPPL